ncbi:MAG: four helix bundle protein [Atribacterota bacterium]|nr:four helix bundle protein [Atribacterota bacterium]MDD4765299.1 four helix bundle protein [Atribacterota bacterium]
MKIKSYKDLKIWNRSIELVTDVYDVTSLFPKNEIYGLTSQIRRSAISIPSNIAEGFTRYYNKEFRHFLYIALGSCAELETQLIIANRLKYLESDVKSKISNDLDIICKMITNLIKKINNDLEIQKNT